MLQQCVCEYFHHFLFHLWSRVFLYRLAESSLKGTGENSVSIMMSIYMEIMRILMYLMHIKFLVKIEPNKCDLRPVVRLPKFLGGNKISVFCTISSLHKGMLVVILISVFPHKICYCVKKFFLFKYFNLVC